MIQFIHSFIHSFNSFTEMLVWIRMLDAMDTGVNKADVVLDRQGIREVQ